MLQLSKLRPRLGKTFIDRLTSDVILAIGNHKFTRSDLVRECHVGHFGAARHLGNVLRDDLSITRPEQLASLAPEDLAAIRGVGETTVYVLLCIQDFLKMKPMEFETTWRTQVNHAQKPKKRKTTNGDTRKRTTKRPSRRSIREQTEVFNTQQPTQ